MTAPALSPSALLSPRSSAPRGVSRPAAPARGRNAIRTPSSQVRIVPPDLRIADGTGASVFRVAANRGPISRDVIAKTTGASIATVNRQVTALLTAGLLRERADLAESGAIGRPRVPVEVDHERYLTVGIHIGAVTTGIVVSDLRGRIIGAVEVPTPAGDQNIALASITASAKAFAARWHRRTPLWVGVALGGRVDSVTGLADHPRLGWSGARVGAVVGGGFGLPISVSAHVEAMAASELLLTPDRDAVDPKGTSLYFYARETVGVALTFDGKVHTPTGGPGSISHLPTGSSAGCTCGAVGCLEATVSDRAVALRARAEGILGDGDETTVQSVYRLARAGSAPAHDLLVERATVLGRTVGMLRDLFNPDRVILGGQAFTEYPAAVPHVANAFARSSTLPRKDIRITGFGNRVQAHAAGVVSLSSLYSDPLAAMRRAAG
ncbi:ROK family protein [Rhodococcus coprophilus]|uniref:NagC family transcriptional regulator n=1 Tax=Rhodococcus coprophilus TaxID=38310 RepID=A0A2X4UF12_9NOCA|nr:ROK family protein [Rhodococcus coprophilus]MBM7459750.1 putative NBD/HSP70 family sugar kinase [Rhodococcus coprophilus]SQI37271.1 NagC family transcriptional regulator [Rhodococcus coprophilus]